MTPAQRKAWLVALLARWHNVVGFRTNCEDCGADDGARDWFVRGAGLVWRCVDCPAARAVAA